MLVKSLVTTSLGGAAAGAGTGASQMHKGIPQVQFETSNCWIGSLISGSATALISNLEIESLTLLTALKEGEVSSFLDLRQKTQS